jgi:hypothetical protein
LQGVDVARPNRFNPQDGGIINLAAPLKDTVEGGDAARQVSGGEL